MSNIFEASRNGESLPRFFWLVLDIPNRELTNDPYGDRDRKQLSDIGSGQLEGVRGISDRKEIMMNWFMVGRNAAIFLPPRAIEQSNDIERIRYDNPDHLCENNLALIYRLFDKEKGGKYRHEQVMQTICGYVLMYLKSLNSNAAWTIDYNKYRPIKEAWEANPSGIDSLNDLKNWFVEQVHMGYPDDQHLNNKEVDEQMRESVSLALKKIGRIYGDEGEWIIHSQHLTIPHGCIMLIAVDMEAKNRYQEWLGNDRKFSGIDGYLWDGRMKRVNNLLKNIKEFGIDQHYDIRYVDSRNWDQVRKNMIDKRASRS